MTEWFMKKKRKMSQMLSEASLREKFQRSTKKNHVKKVGSFPRVPHQGRLVSRGASCPKCDREGEQERHVLQLSRPQGFWRRSGRRPSSFCTTNRVATSLGVSTKDQRSLQRRDSKVLQRLLSTEKKKHMHPTSTPIIRSKDIVTSLHMIEISSLTRRRKEDHQKDKKKLHGTNNGKRYFFVLQPKRTFTPWSSTLAFT